jgi:sugar (pentulose or hexulose) kinase
MDTYVLAVDIGTSNVKAGVFSAGGDLASLVRIEIPIYYPEPGAGVQRLSEIYDSTLRACELALKQAGKDVDALSFSAQMHGLAIVGENGEEITPLITYLDTRPASVLRSIELKTDPYRLYVVAEKPHSPIPIYKRIIANRSYSTASPNV